MGKTTNAITISLIAFLLVVGVGYFLGGFVLMILMGVLHDAWRSNIPTMGYWTSSLVALLIKALVSPLVSFKGPK